ncbi:MAG: ABC transporter permease [Phycisphaerae bacterium]
MNDISGSMPTRPGFYWPCRTLWQREIVRFLRQRSRVIGAFGTPLVFWLLIGGGLGRSFVIGSAKDSPSYLEYSYPGAIAAILLFTAIFSMISIIDDRREGFLQSVLVAPVPRSSIVFGKVLGATTLAVAQAAIFLLLAPLAGISLTFPAILASLGTMILVAVAVTGLGFWMAWIMDSVQGFHAIMNLVLMPMLALSGAFFPPGGSATVLRWVMVFNPMTYAVDLMRSALYCGTDAGWTAGTTSAGAALGVTLLFAALTIMLSVRVVTRRTAGAVR